MSRWPELPLTEVARLTRGTEPGRATYTDASRGIRFLRVGDITGKTDNPVFTDASQLVHVSATDVLLALDGTPGLVSTGHCGAISSGIRRIEPIDPKVVSLSWLRYSLMSPSAQQTISRHTTGVTILHASSAVPHIRIPLPPLQVQESIVRILDEADQLRRLQAEADRRSAYLIPALFQQMFGAGMNYPTKKLSEICGFITKGTTPPASLIKESAGKDDIPFLKVYHITDTGEIAFRDVPAFISLNLHDGLLARSKVYPGDVLMNIVGPPLGKIGIVPHDYPEWNVNQALAIFRARESLEPIYLLHILRSSMVLNKILAQAVGIRQLNLNLEQCRNVEIPLPPLPLQREFATRAKEIRAMLAEQSSSRHRLEDLFQSLLHRAFQGEL